MTRLMGGSGADAALGVETLRSPRPAKAKEPWSEPLISVERATREVSRAIDQAR